MIIDLKAERYTQVKILTEMQAAFLRALIDEISHDWVLVGNMTVFTANGNLFYSQMLAKK